VNDWILDFNATEGDVIAFGFAKDAVNTPELLEASPGSDDLILRVYDADSAGYLDIHLDDPMGLSIGTPIQDLVDAGTLLFA
jgi:hypothetical protein